jgi:type IX secretion system PorP/SprF family membrane protein
LCQNLVWHTGIIKLKKMKKTLTLVAVAVMGMVGTTFGQQDPQFTQFFNTRLMYNPAYAGTNQAICFSALYRQQWVQFPGAPKTGVFNFDMHNQALGGIGFGASIMNDQLGADKTWSARASFAKHFNLGADGNGIFSVGLDAGILQKQINGAWVAPQTLNDPAIPNNAYTGAPNLNKLVPDFGFGAYYTIPNKMYVGISAGHLTGATMKGASGDGGVANSVAYNLNFKMARHYYIIGGYTFRFANPDHAITPNIKVKSDGSSTQLDVNLLYELKNMIWLGASWRMQDAIAPMLGYKQKFGKGTLKIGYSYDVTTSKIKGYSSGTHEIFLSYCFTTVKPPTVTKHQNDRVID